MDVAPTIGNDVVDLRDPTTATAHLRPRFVARVCTVAECARVAQAADPCALLWSLFAAKEAAYKVVSKHRPGIAFAHRLFAVADDLRSVRYAEFTLQLSVVRNGDYIHAVAIEGNPGEPVIDAVEQVGADIDQSEAVRALLTRTLGQHLGCPASELVVQREPISGSWDGYGPPVLRRGEAAAGRDISLSHHGRFVAFAAIATAVRP